LIILGEIFDLRWKNDSDLTFFCFCVIFGKLSEFLKRVEIVVLGQVGRIICREARSFAESKVKLLIRR